MGGTGEHKSRVVIIGAGHAGGRLAERLRGQGFAGKIILIGEEAVAPYERPLLSKEYLAGQEGLERLLVRPLPWYREQNVELRLGQQVTTIDRSRQQVELSDGSRINYGWLVLATGARPRPLNVPGAQHPRVHYLRTSADSEAVRPLLREDGRVLLVGAGVIGLEVAATARSLGAQVSVLEHCDRPMARVTPPSVSALFTELHEQHGVTLRFGDSVSAIQETPTGLCVHTLEGETFESDMLIVGIGVLPNIELAAAAGLAVENGIRVDQRCRTDDPRILAIGDAAAYDNPLLARNLRVETWQNAENHAGIAADLICGKPVGGDPVLWFWTEQYGINVQFVGLPEDIDEIVWRDGPGGPRSVAVYLSNGQVVGGMAWNGGRDMRFIRRMTASGTTVLTTDLANSAIPLRSLLSAEPAQS